MSSARSSGVRSGALGGGSAGASAGIVASAMAADTLQAPFDPLELDGKVTAQVGLGHGLQGERKGGGKAEGALEHVIGGLGEMWLYR